jgi:cysteine desulfurase/selenocysteine lyase
MEEVTIHLSMSIAHPALRQQFPILSTNIDGHPLVYLDTAATAQKPKCVIDAISNFYASSNANINRGMHPLAEKATIAYDDARKIIANVIHAKKTHEIIFTRGTTESISLVARTWGADNIGKGDTIVLTEMEHHSNIVPWLQLQEKTGCLLEWIPVNTAGDLDLRVLEKILKNNTVKLVAVSGLSNVLGALTPLQEIITLAHTHGAKVLVDSAQLIVHREIDVQELDCDFLAFSGHKLYGPMGIGVLYGKEELLRKMPPFLGGGDMIATVSKTGFTSAELPRKFEAGTPSVADAIGLAEAIKWLSTLEKSTIEHYEEELLLYAKNTLQTIDGIRIFGPVNPVGCISFSLLGIHPHDLTEILGRNGICLRAGHHCTQILHASLGVKATTRLSVGLYNTKEDIDVCIAAIKEAIAFLRR